jgi:RHS repeat-associated protein
MTPTTACAFSAASIIAPRYTGKERDTESGNDYMFARYYNSATGRFLSPDWDAKSSDPVPYAKLTDPQTLNLYAYVGNNPMDKTDPTGHYEVNDSDCKGNAKCQKKFDKTVAHGEAAREKDLNSKDPSVRAAAAAFGGEGEKNGVHVTYADLLSQGKKGGTNPYASTPGHPNIQVTIDSGLGGKSMQESFAHEGTHVASDMKFVTSYVPGVGYDQSLNLTHGQDEFNAYKAGAGVTHEHGFGPNDTQKIWDFVNANVGHVNDPVFIVGGGNK